MSEVTVVYAKTRGAPAQQRRVSAMPTPVPGLVIHAALDVAGWMITHAPSGFAVGWFPEADPEAVLACAIGLGSVTDWTVPLPDTQALAPDVLPVLRRWGAEFYRPNVSYDDYQRGKAASGPGRGRRDG